MTTDEVATSLSGPAIDYAVQSLHSIDDLTVALCPTRDGDCATRVSRKSSTLEEFDDAMSDRQAFMKNYESSSEVRPMIALLSRQFL